MMEKKIKSPKQLGRLLDNYAIIMKDDRGKMNYVMMSSGLYTELIFGIRHLQELWEELNLDNYQREGEDQ